jgi:AcrR family transcriptional regulator
MTNFDNPLSLRSRPEQARANLTISLILDTTTAIVVENGADEATTRAIAKRAGIAVGSVYRYFTDREKILRAAYLRLHEAVAGRWFERFGDLAGVSAETAAIKLFDTYIEEANAEPALLPLLRALNALSAPLRADPFEKEPADLIDLYAERLGLKLDHERRLRIQLLKHITGTMIDAWLLALENERPIIRLETVALTAGMVDRMRRS